MVEDERCLSRPRLLHLIALLSSPFVKIFAPSQSAFLTCVSETLLPLQHPPGHGCANLSPDTRKARDKWCKAQNSRQLNKVFKERGVKPPPKPSKPKASEHILVIEMPELPMPQEITASACIYKGKVHEECWKSMKASALGNGPQLKNKFDVDPCPVSAWCNTSTELLVKGGKVKFNQDGRGGETREFVCQSIPKIEKFLAFGQDLHRRKAGTGFANCRLHTKKGQQCMSVV